jgi:hypothetical protein
VQCGQYSADINSLHLQWVTILKKFFKTKASIKFNQWIHARHNEDRKCQYVTKIQKSVYGSWMKIIPVILCMFIPFISVHFYLLTCYKQYMMKKTDKRSNIAKKLQVPLHLTGRNEVFSTL